VNCKPSRVVECISELREKPLASPGVIPKGVYGAPEDTLH